MHTGPLRGLHDMCGHGLLCRLGVALSQAMNDGCMLFASRVTGPPFVEGQALAFLHDLTASAQHIRDCMIA